MDQAIAAPAYGTPNVALPKPGWLTGDVAVGLLFLAYGLVMHVATWGDTNYFVDDTFYALVGQRMHDGLIPYVDIWDRKPFGLFAIYYLIAGVSRSLVAHQVAGLLFSGAAAFAIYKIVSRLANRQGGICAGLAYLCTMCTFDGVNGQAPVFYNALVAWAVFCVVAEIDALARGELGRRIWAAMALCSLALTIKQTTLFESAFLGLYVLYALRRAGWDPARLMKLGAGMALVGALPTLAIAVGYALGGHWHEYWNAMVTANVKKGGLGLNLTLSWIWAISGRIMLIAGIVIWVARRGLPQGRAREFLLAWLVAALIGFLSVPHFFIHYVLPLLVPFSVFAGFLFARAPYGRVWLVGVLCFNWVWFNPLDFSVTPRSNAAMDNLAAIVREHDGGGGLFVYDGPPYLYALTGAKFLSPLVFPHHFNHLTEKDTSHLATQTELARVLAGHPGVIVDGMSPRNFPVNWDSYIAVKVYEHENCKFLGPLKIWEMGFSNDLAIWGDCRSAPRR